MLATAIYFNSQLLQNSKRKNFKLFQIKKRKKSERETGRGSGGGELTSSYTFSHVVLFSLFSLNIFLPLILLLLVVVIVWCLRSMFLFLIAFNEMNRISFQRYREILHPFVLFCFVVRCKPKPVLLYFISFRFVVAVFLFFSILHHFDLACC